MNKHFYTLQPFGMNETAMYNSSIIVTILKVFYLLIVPDTQYFLIDLQTKLKQFYNNIDTIVGLI